MRVCKAQVKWVSSEKQYADGMTTSDAAQLLADRLRSHRMRLTSDINFQSGKKGEAMYAIKKPSEALQAMAATATTISTAQSLNDTDHLTSTNTNDDSFTFTYLLLSIVFAMVVAHSFHLLPQLYSFSSRYYLQLRHWLQGRGRHRPSLCSCSTHPTTWTCTMSRTFHCDLLAYPL